MKGKRKIFLDPELARAAVGSKESLEALAIVLGVKITFISSVVTNATAVRLMHIFGIGQCGSDSQRRPVAAHHPS